MLPRDRRLRRTEEFRAVQRHGRADHNRLLAIRVWRRDGRPSRWGFTVSRRVGGAVARNRLRRRMRALARRDNAALCAGADIVISGRNGAAEASFAELSAAWEQLLRRAGLLNGSPREREPIGSPEASSGCSSR